jgi:hypothetical protein
MLSRRVIASLAKPTRGRTAVSLVVLLPLMSVRSKSISKPVTARPNCQL